MSSPAGLVLHVKSYFTLKQPVYHRQTGKTGLFCFFTCVAVCVWLAALICDYPISRPSFLLKQCQIILIQNKNMNEGWITYLPFQEGSQQICAKAIKLGSDEKVPTKWSTVTEPGPLWSSVHTSALKFVKPKTWIIIFKKKSA